MARTISIGIQSFEDLRTNGYFYVDKTSFVRDWWREGDDVTLVCRPRRFGKTLNLDTVRCFLSTEYAGRGEELFGGLRVWDDPSMHALQGTVPVIFVSFARVKQSSFEDMLKRINTILTNAVREHGYLRGWEGLTEVDRARLNAVDDTMDAVTCANVPNLLCDLLRRYWGIKPVVLLDECDAPMQQAWTHGFWDEATDFMRDLMNSTFKTNESLGRGLITGVTRVSRESIFSDLNNLTVVTTSVPLYQTAFGFTQSEVDDALVESGREDMRQRVCDWYDGFVFDGVSSIYNPWSITHFLRYGVFDAYWANTSSNSLVSSVVRRGGRVLKRDFEELMRGGRISKIIDEQVVFSELDGRPDAVWALLLAAGYLRAPGPVPEDVVYTPRPLELTNREVQVTFDRMVKGWFQDASDDYDDLCTAILAGDAETATDCLAEVVYACASSFDVAGRPSRRSAPERFYHGLVLGLLAKLRGRYSVESNRQSGYGRYDVALVPTDGATGTDSAAVIEFKVFDPRHEETLEDTCARALAQIEDKRYVAGLVERGISRERIHVYGMGFRGKECLVELEPVQ